MPEFYQNLIDDYCSILERVLVTINFTLISLLLTLYSISDDPVCSLEESSRNSPLNQLGILSASENNASFLSRITLWWYTHIAFEGWKKTFTDQQLWNLPKNLTTWHLFTKYTSHLENQSRSDSNSYQYMKLSDDQPIDIREDSWNSENEIKIKRIMARVYFWQFLSSSLCKLAYETIQFAIPILLR